MSHRALRILVVHNHYRSGQPSGEDRVVEQEVDLLRSVGHHVTTFERHSDDIARMPLARRAAVPARVPWNGRARDELTARLRAERPDVVHIHNTFPLLSPAVVQACVDAGVPAVATLHNYLQVCPSGTLFRDGRICTDCTGRFPAPSVRHGCYRGSRLATVPLAAALLAHRARSWSGVSRFFCVSAQQRHTLVQGGMPADRLVVKPNFVVDAGVRRTAPGEYVLYLGRMTLEKGVPLLMAAWDRVRAAGGLGMPLVLAGGGPLEDDVRAWADGRADVRFLGMRSTEECAELMARAAVVVAPSAWLEVFGLVVVEAMAAAVPTVASAHGSFVELVEDDRTGVLHRPGDAGSLAEALQRTVWDTAGNLAMGEAARRSYEARFTPEVGLAALTRGYEAALAGAGGGEPV